MYFLRKNTDHASLDLDRTTGHAFPRHGITLINSQLKIVGRAVRANGGHGSIETKELFSGDGRKAIHGPASIVDGLGRAQN
jgi:hypothetical protein